MKIEEMKLTPKRKDICRRLDFQNSEDILRYYPTKYETFVLTHFVDFVVGERVVFEGELISYPTTFRYRGNLSRTSFKVLYEQEELTITIFNRPWVKSDNHRLVIVGKYEGNNKVTATNFYNKDIKDILGIMPIYGLKEGIKQNEVAKLVQYALKVSDDIVDKIPLSLRKKHGLVDLNYALTNIHKPVDSLSLKKSLAYLKYEEFLRFYLSLEALKGNGVSFKIGKVFDDKLIYEVVSELPYELTVDQTSCLKSILDDLHSGRHIYRLIQGEVGSGKTIIALLSLYANYLAGYQGAIMTPTAILANQHFESFREILKDRVNIGLLMADSENKVQLKKEIAHGSLDIVIGTHALFSEDVNFNNLGLVITDEQQRFGVKQRRALKEKGDNVDFLLMSATPIPRTLASSLYGDMAISTIASLPSGRRGCDTYLIKENSIRTILDKINKKLSLGEQIYIIGSSIAPGEGYSGKDVLGLYAILKNMFLPHRVGLIHGRLSNEEKDTVMNDFRENNIQILISTTVIEVGISVKNATTMIIYDADRFGLSQLHQLRGRVQRGYMRGTCYLLTSKTDDEVLNRLKVLVNSNDGFEISYQDLKIRGPGDILGIRQSGLPSFVLGDVFTDNKIIESAKEDVREIINNLDNEDYQRFYDEIAQAVNKSIVD